MKCKACNKTAIISGYCKEHFKDYFEKTVENTVKKYNLLKKGGKVAVAVSGGKDSLATLYILKKLGYDVEGLAIDEGIKGYRETTLKDLKNFSKNEKIKIKIFSFEKEFGTTLDEAVKKLKKHPCLVCGVLRRFLLNKYSKNYDAIATGHNLDDEAQSMLMNIFKAQNKLSARLGPITGIKHSNSFTKRIKPLYFLKEKEVKAYTILEGFSIHFTECPYSHSSFRYDVQNFLNDYESKNPGAKIGLVQSFLKELPKMKEEFGKKQGAGVCKECGEPSANKICRACMIMQDLKARL